MAVAFTSILLDRPVGEIAFTGEINARGEVMEIGGVAAKLSGALRNGITRIIMPASNRKDFNELHSDFRARFEVDFVTSLTGALGLVWPDLAGDLSS